MLTFEGSAGHKYGPEPKFGARTGGNVPVYGKGWQTGVWWIQVFISF